MNLLIKKIRVHKSSLLLILPALMVLILIFFFPITEFLYRSISEPVLGLQNYITFFEQPAFVSSLINTFKISLIVTLITLILGYSLAYKMTTVSAKMSNLILLAVLLPFWTALLVRAFTWMILLQDTGVINEMLMFFGLIDEPINLFNSIRGVTIGMVYIMIPFIVLPLRTTMEKIDQDLILAAKSLGASPFKAFIKVFFPLSLPGVAVGSILVFVMSIGYYIIPAILGSTKEIMLGEFIAEQIQTHLNWGLGAAAGAILVFATFIFFFIYLRFNREN